MTKLKCKLCGLEDGACICAHLRSSPGIDAVAIRKAFDDWAWNRKGEPIGYMSGSVAARIGFEAGVEFARASLQTAPPTGGGVEPNRYDPTTQPYDEPFKHVVSGKHSMTFKDEKAIVSHLPSHSGDGYSYGGGSVLTIGGVSLFLGEEKRANELAWEIANRWNRCALQTASPPPAQETNK